ncbi:sensor histidine kinase [Bordetella sp. 2513F-2]
MSANPIASDLHGAESSARFWRAQVLGWLFLGVSGFFIRWAAFGNAVAAFWLTVAMEPLAFVLTSSAACWHGRHSSRTAAPALVLACAALLCLAAAALLASIAYGIHGLFPPGNINLTPASQYRLAFLYYLGIFSIWTLAFFGVKAELAARGERMSKMNAETRALRLELEHLQLQVEPHFLFNALNTIVAEIADRPAIAEEMTRRLAFYLRYSLDKGGAGLCRLEEEVEAAEYYMRIQALRFDERFEYRCRVDPDTLGAWLPHMMLQGLVENAIKHGMRCVQERFAIDMRIRREGEDLVIEVENPGRLQAPNDLVRSGGGLGNLRRRLDLRYPGRSTFSLTQRGGSILAEIRLRGEPVLL